MPRTLRLKIAREYLSLLESIGEPKQAMKRIREMYGAKRSSVYNYVSELRRRR